MKYIITEQDKELLLQKHMQYKIRITVTNSAGNIIDVLNGIADTGGIQIDAGSNIRRTCSVTLKLEEFIHNIEEKIAGWMGLYYEVDIGIYSIRDNTFHYYPNGRYCITQASTQYDASTNSISLSLSDRISELDGSRNGQLGGAPVISIPKEINGQKQTLRNAVINLLSSSTNISKYIIDDVGDFYGMAQNNSDYEAYRRMNDEWNVLPYDLEYAAGALMSDILFDIRDLYPNCQMYFDVYDNFCFDGIPSLEKDVPDMDNAFVQKIILSQDSESVSYDITSIKNVTEVFGNTYEADRFAEASSHSGNCYSLTLTDYTGYRKYDSIAFTPPADNSGNPVLKINSLDPIPMYREYTQTPLDPGSIKKDTMCVVEIYKTDSGYAAYYLGQYQPHALCVLTNNADDSRYTKKYFSDKYNVPEKNIVFRIEPHSPYCVQKLGEILDVKSGNDFDNIRSDTNAVENAKYYNRLSSTVHDTVTITTKLIPWLDVNVKVNYKKSQENVIDSYIVTSRTDNFLNGTSAITMYRFSQLYE